MIGHDDNVLVSSWEAVNVWSMPHVNDITANRERSDKTPKVITLFQYC